MKFKVIAICVAYSLFLISCNSYVDTRPTVTQASQSDATVVVEWSEAIWHPQDEHEINLEHALNDGIVGCRNWGFRSAQYFGNASAFCDYKEFSSYYNCEFRQLLQCVPGEYQELPSILFDHTNLKVGEDRTIWTILGLTTTLVGGTALIIFLTTNETI